LSASNIIYKQVNCFELFLKFLQNYALEQRLSENEARERGGVKNYDTERNCKKLCRLECERTQYKISDSVFSLVDFLVELYYSKDIPSIEKKLNITIN